MINQRVMHFMQGLIVGITLGLVLLTLVTKKMQERLDTCVKSMEAYTHNDLIW